MEIIVVDKDYKSHKKYLMAMKKYKDIPVITVDDDISYDTDMVSVLYNDHLAHPNVIVGGRIRKIEFDSKGKALRYKLWKFTDEKTPSLDLFPTTGGGTLFPPEFCRLVNDSIPDMVRKTNTQT